MQELLTGKRRFPEFSEDWKTESLGEVFTFSGGVSASRDQPSRPRRNESIGISKTNIARVLLRIPPFREQTAIAEVLSDIDADIAAIEAELAKARAIKQGMMQVLLTGRIRLV